MIFGFNGMRFGSGPRVVRIPLWAMVLGGFGLLAALSLMTVVALGVALVAVPLLVAGGALARLMGTRRPEKPVPVRATWTSPRSAQHNEPVVIDATWEDVTDKTKR